MAKITIDDKLMENLAAFDARAQEIYAQIMRTLPQDTATWGIYAANRGVKYEGYMATLMHYREDTIALQLPRVTNPYQKLFGRNPDSFKSKDITLGDMLDIAARTEPKEIFVYEMGRSMALTLKDSMPQLSGLRVGLEHLQRGITAFNRQAGPDDKVLTEDASAAIREMLALMKTMELYLNGEEIDVQAAIAEQKARPAIQQKVMVVDPDNERSYRIAQHLTGQGYDVESISDPERAVARLQYDPRSQTIGNPDLPDFIIAAEDTGTSHNGHFFADITKDTKVRRIIITDRFANQVNSDSTVRYVNASTEHLLARIGDALNIVQAKQSGYAVSA